MKKRRRYKRSGLMATMNNNLVQLPDFDLFFSRLFLSLSLSLSPPPEPLVPAELKAARPLLPSLRRQSSQKDLASLERCRGSRSGAVAAAASVAALAKKGPAPSPSALAAEGGPPVRRSTVVAPMAQNLPPWRLRAAGEGLAKGTEGRSAPPLPLLPPLRRRCRFVFVAARRRSQLRRRLRRKKIERPHREGPANRTGGAEVGERERETEEGKPRRRRRRGRRLLPPHPLPLHPARGLRPGQDQEVFGLDVAVDQTLLNFGGRGRGKREGNERASEREGRKRHLRETERRNEKEKPPPLFLSFLFFQPFRTTECRAAHPSARSAPPRRRAPRAENRRSPAAASLEVPAAEARTRWIAEVREPLFPPSSLFFFFFFSSPLNAA